MSMPSGRPFLESEPETSWTLTSKVSAKDFNKSCMDLIDRKIPKPTRCIPCAEIPAWFSMCPRLRTGRQAERRRRRRALVKRCSDHLYAGRRKFRRQTPDLWKVQQLDQTTKSQQQDPKEEPEERRLRARKKVRDSTKHCIFRMFCASGCSKGRLAKDGACGGCG